MEFLTSIFQILATVAALNAAYFWLKAAKVATPEEFGVARYASTNALKENYPEKAWARDVSLADSRGAVCPAVSAILTATSLMMQIVAPTR